MTGVCLSSRKDRAVLYAIKKEPTDLSMNVIRRDDFRSVRNELISIE